MFSIVLRPAVSSTPSKSPNRVQHFKGHEQDLSEKGIEFPIKVKDIPNIERQSPTLIIDLFCYEEQKQLFSFYISEQQREKHVLLAGLPDLQSVHKYTQLLDLKFPFLTFAW